MVAGIDPAPRGQADQDEDLKPKGGAIERCRPRHTGRHTSAHHLALRVLARRRQRYTNFANSFALVARRAGVPFRCHDLRHAFASTFLQATGNIPALQAILGHKTIAMTMRYAHIVTSHLHRAMAEFGTKTGTIGTVSSGTADADIPPSALKEKGNGGGWIRTNVGVRQRIYSPSPLASRAPLRAKRASRSKPGALSTKPAPATPPS